MEELEEDGASHRTGGVTEEVGESRDVEVETDGVPGMVCKRPIGRHKAKEEVQRVELIKKKLGVTEDMSAAQQARNNIFQEH